MKKVEITPLKKISVKGGDVFRGLKNSDLPLVVLVKSITLDRIQGC